MIDRVRKPEKFEGLLKQLKEEEKIFSSYKDILIFAACLAKSRQVREPFLKSSEPIPLHIFSGEFDMAVINAIAITEQNDYEIQFLSEENQERKIMIFEEYAAAGLQIIEDEVLSRGKSVLESFIELLADEEADKNLLGDISSLAY
ncbi:conserved hypothetical protein [Tolumonas auensis DSM 9187]|uniref:DNA phosphorothioation-associated protein 4 n=2 Tax=Tolumonas TaxID=43947 RepID=C4LF35_TOLAT|nr:conserved hypothetical protein [Tolumonas auensis DSM 9187]